jgi:Predicted solute binding protein
MRHHRGLRSAVVTAVAGAACLAVPTPVWAASAPAGHRPASAPLAADPPGANGTVTIDGVPLDGGTANEPHVTCSFEVAFFNFDEGERATIVFTAHPPTGNGTELLRLDNVLVSDDPAGGAAPDPDETFVFTADQLGLAGYEAHPRQGYHVKLVVELVGAPGAGKHKVFWLAPCPQPTPTGTPTATPSGGTTPTPPAETPTTTPPAEPTPADSPTAPPTGPATPSLSPAADAGGAGGEGLPLTGPAVAGIVLLGLALVGAGAALIVVRRRKVTWTA